MYTYIKDILASASVLRTHLLLGRGTSITKRGVGLPESVGRLRVPPAISPFMVNATDTAESPPCLVQEKSPSREELNSGK